jgi:hypothetical protein
MTAIPQAITPNPNTNLLNVFIQIANKMGFQPKKMSVSYQTEVGDQFLDLLDGLLFLR